MTKETTEAEKSNNEVIDAGSKIEAIKNLIFGENILAYDSEFESLKKDIALKRDELKSFVEETRQELDSLIDNLSTDLNIRITELETDISDRAEKLDAKKVDKKILGELLVKLGNQIGQ